jgi:hypothetical protein
VSRFQPLNTNWLVSKPGPQSTTGPGSKADGQLLIADHSKSLRSPCDTTQRTSSVATCVTTVRAVRRAVRRSTPSLRLYKVLPNCQRATQIAAFSDAYAPEGPQSLP